MHVIVNLEERGIPAVAIVSEEFRTGAIAQGRALGFDPAVIYVEHPFKTAPTKKWLSWRAVLWQISCRH